MMDSARTSRTAVRRRLTALALLAITVVAIPLIVRGPAAFAATNGTIATTLDSKRAEFTFNVPKNDAQIDKVVALINGAPAGSQIRMGIFSVDRPRVYDAIAAAKRRGVAIYVVHSGDKRSYAATDSRRIYAEKIRTLLGSGFRWCDHGTSAAATTDACISTATSGIMHAKYMLFTKTKDSAGTLRSNVVWYSSANFTTGSGIDLFNNSTTIYSDATLYAGFRKHVFDPMWAERSYAGNDYYDSGTPRGYFGSTASNSQVYVAPEQQYDLVNTRLTYVKPDSDCRVRVMQNTLHANRPQVLDRLVGFKRGGCKVWVVLETIDRESWDRLHAAGIPMHQAKVHDKTFVISARYDGSAKPRSVILNGSHNITKSALRYNDELLVKLTDNSTMYTAFFNHFNDAYNQDRALPRP